MTNLDGFKPAKPEDLEKFGGGSYGTHKTLLQEFLASGETCVIKVFETDREAKRVRDGLNSSIRFNFRGKAAVSKRGKAVMIERL